MRPTVPALPEKETEPHKVMNNGSCSLVCLHHAVTVHLPRAVHEKEKRS